MTRFPLPARKPRNNAEFRLQCALVQHIALAGRKDMWWSALPFGEFRSKRTAARLKAQGVRPGAPDLAFVCDGHFFGLEVKTRDGRQSPEQRRTEQEIRDGGGVYAVGYGLDDCLRWLIAWNILPEGYGYVPARRQQLRLGLEAAA